MATHGIMFHHFHSSNHQTIHCQQQGSIDETQLYQMICYFQDKKYNILNADEYIYKVTHDCVSENDIVFTFDDNLLCQYEVAGPVLEKCGIKGFWFINTMNLVGEKTEFLEIFRHFRNYAYSSIHDFYNDFFEKVKETLSFEQLNSFNSFNPNQYLLECPFYSEEDKKFKYCRDELLNYSQYEDIMFALIKKKEYDWSSFKNMLWMKEMHIKQLASSGHIIGLHSHSHSTTIHKISYEEQYNDYLINKNYLEEICHTTIVAMSHPCGNYSEDTLKVLGEIGIKIGFLDYLYDSTPASKLLLPREDHANILKRI